MKTTKWRAKKLRKEAVLESFPSSPTPNRFLLFKALEMFSRKYNCSKDAKLWCKGDNSL